ncbi:hypothetical protein [Psychroflexus planctonicus]|uniref:Tail fiber protein n=1 Tax=Psychroflexus planctonicus TaxID=1526575 RepID=A0ABQ1SLM0_9FLAO|nr:hypothetical protein [Psychroflexus planctonicus]GGE45239.1 hypothetical protein GCM10010832_26440 [Psychroflexus planctonicus]
MEKSYHKKTLTVYFTSAKSIFVFLIIVLLGINKNYAQVGIGTTTPDETAILELKSTERGLLFPRMSSNNRINITTPATGLHVFDTDTNSAWFFDGSNWVNYATQSKYGDVKSGIQSADHDGWVLLDGRALSSLSTAQQNVATSLGLSGNLPDATDAYLVQNNTAMASVTGTNTTTLTQANLPNTTFTGSTNNTGSHNHSGSTSTAGNHRHDFAIGNQSQRRYLTMQASGYSDYLYGSGSNQTAVGTLYYSTSTSSTASYPAMSTGSWSTTTRDNPSIAFNGNHSHSLSINSNGNHTHTVTVNSGGTSEPIAIKPRSLSVNMFIYLGL